MQKSQRTKRMKFGGYVTRIDSEDSWAPLFRSHLMINADTDYVLRSRRECSKILRFIAREGKLGTPLLCKSKRVRTDGLDGYSCCLITETTIATVRIYKDNGVQSVRMNFEFGALVDVDQILLDIVERLVLKTLDWTYYDRNTEIELIDDQERFDGVNIKRYD